MIYIASPEAGKSALTEPILRALPDWFGIEEATLHYIEYTEANPTLIAYDDAEAVGFLALMQHSSYAAEIYVMAVLPAYHRRGVGRALVAAAEADLRARGVEYLQVKTLADADPDAGYARTRAFYRALGFRDLEVFPDLWSAENPCLLLVKRL
jgi:ribosomal protein S18 acetylase RimI-like enzyme